MAEHQQHPAATFKSFLPEKGPSTTQILAVVTLLPIGGILLTLSGITLTGSFIGLALATPVFIIFSPVIVPATIVVGLAVAGFLTSGAFGLTALSSLSWIANYIRGDRTTVPDHLDHAKRRMMDMGGYLGQRTKDMAQGVEGKARAGHEGART
ncbi:oleosin H2-like [Magnolia sinica]|uniref:oleosin H2-like n=1 Tax=Magnolia sinica TaxID=86752 RepID=UPI00265A605B|nr:oleosin H2-like [Magnolia sinica]